MRAPPWAKRSLAAACSLFLVGGTGDFTTPAWQAPPILIQNATVIDGTGSEGSIADVRIRDGRIESVGSLSASDRERVIDATGLVLAPGFIDTHSHHDGGLPQARDALAALSQGITTIVVGQDGSSQFPLGEFFSGLEAAPATVNVASYVGHSVVRTSVMGDDYRRAATASEIDKMRAVLRRELRAGALGLSTGLEYDVGLDATTDEVIALAREAAAVGGRYVSHLRSEDRHLEEAIEELIQIGQEAEIPVQISHMKLAMKSLWGRSGEILERLDRAREAGVDVTADVYPYEFWQSTMTVLFPDRDFDDRNTVQFVLDELAPPEGMFIAQYDPDPSYVGMSLDQVAESRAEDPATTYMALIAESQALAEETGQGTESIIARSMHPEDIATLLAWPHTNVSSDGGLSGRHPRGFGAFTRVLRVHVREEGHLGLPEAIRKMTSAAADHVGIQGRGIIRPGAYADLVLFDPETVADRATPDAPNEPSAGIDRVLVNGVVVYEDGAVTPARPGRVIRRTDWDAVDAVFADYDNLDTPGCALGIVQGGNLGYARGYGMANLEHGIAITPQSVFRTGSVAKQFTAAAIAIAAREGAISLDDPVRKWIPKFQTYPSDPTIRHTTRAGFVTTLS
jgi:N-acyl-D-amino-acid deacylase